MKRKLIVFSAFLSVLLLFFNFPVKANEVTFPSFPLPVEGMSSTHYLILRDNETDNYFLFMPSEPSEVKMTLPSNEYRILLDCPTIIYTWNTWNENPNNWNIYKEIEVWDDFRFHRNKYENGTVEFLYSSFDLYYSQYYNQGELFFRKAPIKANFLEQMKMVQMGATLETLVSLIPLLLVLVTSFLAFRKALAWLLRVLRKA